MRAHSEVGDKMRARPDDEDEKTALSDVCEEIIAFPGFGEETSTSGRR